MCLYLQLCICICRFDNRLRFLFVRHKIKIPFNLYTGYMYLYIHTIFINVVE